MGREPQNGVEFKYSESQAPLGEGSVDNTQGRYSGALCGGARHTAMCPTPPIPVGRGHPLQEER